MLITITIEQLKKVGACHDGIETFKEFFKDESVTIEWTREKQIELFKSPIGKYIGWAVYQGIIPVWTMDKTDFCEANLEEVNLERLNISGADMRGAYMSRANMIGANMSGANMSRADMRGANMSWANMSWADMSGAYMSWANMSWADMSGANMSGADMRGADMSGADISGAYIRGANLEGTNLCRAVVVYDKSLSEESKDTLLKYGWVVQNGLIVKN